jgi:hypothetical protein
MFCVIQKVLNKKPNRHGAHKELLANEVPVTVGEVVRIKYGFQHSKERFERPILDAYKISIHQNYRENGIIQKRQWSICTMCYYDLLDSGPADHTNAEQLKVKLKEMDISARQLWGLIHEKLDPIIEAAKAEFEASEEYQAMQFQKKQLKAWRMRKTLFEKTHGEDAYEFCYDFFHNIKNPEYEKELRNAFEKRQEEKRFRQQRQYEQRNRSNYNDNHSSSDYSSKYVSSKNNAYSEEERGLLKKFYRKLAKEFHPDVTQGDGAAMVLLNKLKDSWGI